MMNKQERVDLFKKLRKQRVGKVQLVSDGSPNHTTLLCDGVEIPCKFIRIPIITPGSGPISIETEIYLDDLDVGLDHASVVFTAKADPNED